METTVQDRESLAPVVNPEQRAAKACRSQMPRCFHIVDGRCVANVFLASAATRGARHVQFSVAGLG